MKESGGFEVWKRLYEALERSRREANAVQEQKINTGNARLDRVLRSIYADEGLSDRKGKKR